MRERVMERIWESFKVEIERDNSKRVENGFGKGLEMKDDILSTIWAKFTLLSSMNSVDQKFLIDHVL